jgi:hypothetical protein
VRPGIADFTHAYRKDTLILAGAPTLDRGCTPVAPSFEFWDETLGQAREQRLDYPELVHEALAGDREALGGLIEFSAKTDAAGALGHGCTILRTLDSIGDERFAQALLEHPVSIRKCVGEVIKAGLDYGPQRIDPTSAPRLYPQTFLTIAAKDKISYRNGRFGFAIDYPATMTAYESDNSDGVTLMDPDLPQVEFWFCGRWAEQVRTPPDLVRRYENMNGSPLPGLRYVSLDGMQGIEFDHSKPGDGLIPRHGILVHDHVLISYGLSGPRSKSPDALKRLDEIISTLRPLGLHADSEWRIARDALAISPTGAEWRKLGLALWDRWHEKDKNPNGIITSIELQDVGNSPGFYLAKVDRVSRWWGTWAVFKIKDEKITWLFTGGHDEQSIDRIEVHRLAGWEHLLLAVYGMTHQGHGNVYLYELDAGQGRARFLKKTFVTDQQHDWNLLSPTTLAMRAADLNGDSSVDLEFSGTVQLFTDESDEPVGERPVRKVLTWDEKQKTFVEDRKQRTGFESYSGRE